MDDVRHQTAVSSSSSSSSPTNGVVTAETNGGGKKDGKQQQHVNGNGVESEDNPSLALPQAVVEDALRVTRESLEMVCEIEGDGT